MGCKRLTDATLQQRLVYVAIGKLESPVLETHPNIVVDVCVCTRDPRRSVLHIALAALGRQTFERTKWRLLLVDNASAPPLDSSDCAALDEAGVSYRIVRESRVGISFGRLRAITETSAPLLIFVDDDNELADDYLATAVRIFDEEPKLGCAGPRLRAGPSVRIPAWAAPVREWLAINDGLGDDPLTESVTTSVRNWSSAAPPGAGMVVRREVVELYREFEDQLSVVSRNCEDMLLALQAHRVGLLCGYRPQLSLFHHLSAERFRFRAMARMFMSSGRSEAAMFRLVRARPPWVGADAVRRQFWRLVQLAHRDLGVRSALLLVLRDGAMLRALLPDLEAHDYLELAAAAAMETVLLPMKVLRRPR